MSETFRIAICDDDKMFLELEKNIIADYLKQKGLVFVVNCYSTGESLLADRIKLDMFDLIILDVEMKGIDGVSVAKKIREHNEKINIAFLSAYMNYSTDGYHVRAIRYILKEKDGFKDYLQECLDCVLGSINLNERTITLDFSIGKRELKISDIQYIKSSGNYSVFAVSNDSKELYMIRKPLKKVTEQMGTLGFISVHKNVTVNISRIKSVSRYKVFLDDGSVFDISQKKYDEVYRAYILYRGKTI